jgi:protein-L-isoaspartate O-methyltransferase
MTYSATYSPDDNNLRLYASSRLDAETYARVKAAGFRWAAAQGLFVAPMWTPEREDLLIELAGEIGDEDTSLTERAEERAERFEGYQENRTSDAEQAREAVARIADGIPLGQPILIGHHSERHARRDAERIEAGMRKAVRMWQTAKYWQDRAGGAIRHAKYKERPDVRARRIKGLEAELRKMQRMVADADRFNRAWQGFRQITRKDGPPLTEREQAMAVANFDHCSLCFTLAEYPRGPEATSNYEGQMSLHSALDHYIITADQAAELARGMHERGNVIRARWVEHYENRLAYERAMLADAGGTVADRTGPEKGGGCRCWASPPGGWSYIAKVNKVSVTVLDNWGNAGGNFTRTIPFDKLGAIMTAAQVREAREAGRLVETEDKTGFYLHDAPKPPPPTEPTKPNASDFEAMAQSLRAGVRVVTAPDLFPTPPDLARRMVELAEIQPDNRVLEPSAGTGSLVDAILRRAAASQGVRLVAVERVQSLAQDISGRFQMSCQCADFLSCNGNLGTFDRVVMNPPFSNAEDVKHIRHALTFLRPGGRLVALCANGPRQTAQLQPIAERWEELPTGTFGGTGVRAVLLTINHGAKL